MSWLETVRDHVTAEAEGRSTHSDPVVRGGQDVLGRTIDTDSHEYYELKNLGDYDTITRHLSTSAEAQGLGIDPLDWGNSVVDPETLTGSDREQYDAWSQYNSGPYYSSNKEFMGWVGDRGSLDVYHGEQQGSIQQGAFQTEDGDWVNQTIVTEDAINRFGADNLSFSGSRRGEHIIAPANSGLDIGNTQTVDYGDHLSSDFVAYGTTGNPKDGVVQKVGGALGLSDDVVNFAAIGLGVGTGGAFGATLTGAGLQGAGASAGLDESYFIVDPLNVGTGVFHGSEGYEANVAAGSRLTGLDAQNVQRAQGVGRAVVGAALGPVGATALAGMSQAGVAQAGYQSWGDAFANTSIAAAGHALGGWAGEQGLGMAGSIGANAAVAGGTAYAQGRLTGGLSNSEAFERAAIAGMTSGVTAGAQHTLGFDGALSGAGFGAASGAFAAAAFGGDTRWGAFEGAATGAVSGAQRRTQSERFDAAQAAQQENIMRYDEWAEQDSLGGWGYGAPPRPELFSETPDRWQDRARQLYSFEGASKIRPAVTREGFLGPSIRSVPDEPGPISSGAKWAANKGVGYMDAGADWVKERWQQEDAGKLGVN